MMMMMMTEDEAEDEDEDYEHYEDYEGPCCRKKVQSCAVPCLASAGHVQSARLRGPQASSQTSLDPQQNPDPWWPASQNYPVPRLADESDASERMMLKPFKP